MKNRYISHHPCTKELNIDRFNIDFIRYFKLYNFILALIGSVTGAVLWLSIKPLLGWSLLINLNLMYIIIIFGAGIFFALTSMIVYLAGNSKFESCRLSSRRALFTFTVMIITLMFILILFGKIYWNQQFFYFVKYFVTGLIFTALGAVPLDYGIGFIISFRKKKRYDLI
jgi:hypothetical protein